MSVDADNLSSSEKTCDVIGEEFENISAEVPVLRQPTNWDPKSPETREDYTRIGQGMSALAEDAMHWDDKGVARLMFEADTV